MKILLVVDMLNDFVHPDGSLYFEGGSNIIPAIEDKIESAREEGYLIVYLKDTHADDDSEFKLFPRHCVVGTWGSDVVGALAPEATDFIVSKTRFSGFFDTNLDRIIRDAKEIHVVGICTSICVMDTVQGLGYRNMNTIVHKDMTADLTPEDHEYALKRMEVLYGANIV
jgi:nicotinamidase-related amidase